MLINEITAIVGPHKRRKRLGRGRASGQGKTSGRGQKGCHSRAGYSRKRFHEGGAMPFFRRIPKRGFSNVNFTRRYEVVNVSQLDNIFNDGTSIDVKVLFEAGLVDDINSQVKILGDGHLTKKLDVAANKFSKTAEEKISGCGGTARVVA